MVVASDSPKGLGRVYKADQYVADVAYRFVETEAPAAVIEGYLQIVRAVQDQLNYGDELTLHLPDGRHIDIIKGRGTLTAKNTCLWPKAQRYKLPDLRKRDRYETDDQHQVEQRTSRSVPWAAP